METAAANKKFLVIQTAFIGDVILATAVLEKLHQQFPGSFIGMVIKKGCEELFTDHPYINKLYVWNKKNGKYRNLLAIIRKVRFEKFDYAINLHRFTSSGLLTIFSKAKLKTGFNKNPFSFLYDVKVKHEIGIKNPVHETVRNNRLLQRFAPGPPERMRLYPSPQDEEFVAPYKHQPYVTVAPVSVWFTKQYPMERWAEFIQNIQGRFSVYLLGAQSDRPVITEMMNHTPGNSVYNLAGELSLLQTAALIRDARMNFSNDSAPLHLASAMNAPVTAVFCSTVPEFGFGPLSDNAAVVQTDELLTCRPCGLHGLRKCPEGTMACAYGIPVTKLIDRIKP